MSLNSLQKYFKCLYSVLPCGHDITYLTSSIWLEIKADFSCCINITVITEFYISVHISCYFLKIIIRRGYF